MAKQTINNKEKGSIVRAKLNENFTENYTNITILQNADNFETTAASKTIGLNDVGKNLRCTGITVITVPLASTTDFADNDIIILSQDGAGEVSIVATGGVTIKSLNGNLKLTGQYASAYLQNETGDIWWLIGELKA